MNRTELAEAVASQCGISKTKSYEITETIFKTIGDELVNSGQSVQIKDFGIFKVRSKAERLGRNPQTGESITVPAKNVIKFDMSKTLRERMLG